MFDVSLLFVSIYSSHPYELTNRQDRLINIFFNDIEISCNSRISSSTTDILENSYSGNRLRYLIHQVICEIFIKKSQDSNKSQFEITQN